MQNIGLKGSLKVTATLRTESPSIFLDKSGRGRNPRFLFPDLSRKDRSDSASRVSNCKLNSLNLSYNFTFDEGVTHLAEALNHSNCEVINSPAVYSFSSFSETEYIQVVEHVASSSY